MCDCFTHRSINLKTKESSSTWNYENHSDCINYPNLYKKYVDDRDSTRDQANLLGKISCRVVNS